MSIIEIADNNKYQRALETEEVNRLLNAIEQIKDYLRKEDVWIEYHEIIEKELEKIEEFRWMRGRYDGYGDKPAI